MPASPHDPDGSSPLRLLPGEVLDDRFRLQRLLGRGGMGAVYEAHDLQSGRQVAIKTVTGELSPSRRGRFEREGRITASLRHPGIVALHSAGQTGGRPYLVYELVDGARELGAVLPELARDRRVALLRDAAVAVGHAHAQGVIHRDVKLENLLVDAQGQLRVADFGLASAVGDERLTRTGALLGTPHYMAPEQLEGDTGPYTDVWALGVLLYRALTDEMPFEGGTLPELIGAVQAGVQSPRELDPTISRDLERVTLRALAADKRARYPDAAALATDLDACLRGERVAQRGGGAARAVAALAVVILGAGILARRTAPSAPAPTPSPSATPAAPPPQALSPAQLAVGEGELRRLELASEAPGAERLARFEAWLARWKDHPQAPRARRLLDALRLEVPWRYDALVLEDGAKRPGLPLFSERSLFCFAGDQAVELELAASGRGVREVRRFTLPVRAKRVLWAPDGGFLITSSASVYHVTVDGTHAQRLLSVPPEESSDLLAVWDTPQGLVLVIAYGSQVRAYPLTLGAQPSVGAPRVIGDYTGKAYALVASHDRRHLAISVDEDPQRIDLLGPAPRTWRRADSESPCGDMSFSPDTQLLATGHDNGIVILLDRSSDLQRPFLEKEHADSAFQGVPVAHLGGIRRVVFNADGTLLVTSARRASVAPSSAVKLWRVETGELLRTIHVPGDIETVQLHPTRLRVAMGYQRGRFEVWDLE